MLLFRSTFRFDVNFELRSRLELLSTGRAYVVIAVAPFVLLLDVILEVRLDGKFRMAYAAPVDAVFVALVPTTIPLGVKSLIAQGANEPSRGLVALRMA